MKKVYTVEDTEIQDVLDETHDAFLAALKSQNPEINSIVDDDEVAELHDMFALMRSGHVALSHLVCNNVRHIILEVREK